MAKFVNNDIWYGIIRAFLLHLMKKIFSIDAKLIFHTQIHVSGPGLFKTKKVQHKK